MNRRRLLVVLLVYYALHLVVRLLISDGVHLDEAEQLVAAQDLRLGYGAQPPLYTWIQALAFRAFGLGLFALALVKQVLMAGLLVLVFHAARAFTPDDRLALVATITLGFIPEFAWQSHVSRSHSVIATAAGAATLLAASRLFSRRPTAAYAWLGLAAGVGVLGKYNYLLFAVPLLVAGLTLRRWRRVLLDRRIALTVLVFLVVTGPHLYWVATHTEVVAARTAKYFRPGLVRGLWTFVSALVGMLGPLLLAFLVVVRRARSAGPRPEAERLLGRTMLGSVVGALLIVVAAGVPLRERWLLPSLFVAPLYLTVRLREHLHRKQRRALVVLAGLVLVGVLQAIPVRAWTGRWELTAPYRELAVQIRDRVGPEPDCIVAGSNLVGGNMRLEFPDTPVMVAAQRAGAGVVVWEATHWPGPPPQLKRLVGDRPVEYVEKDGYRLGFARRKYK